MSVSETNSSTAVERAFGILEAVSERSSGMTNSEISRKLEIPKSTASYLLNTLTQLGYLHKEEETGKFRLGLKLMSLGRAVQVGEDLKEVALPVMRKLVERTGLTAHLAVLDHGEVVYLEKVDAPSFIQMNTWVGKRMQVNSTAVGKAIAANLEPYKVEAILKQYGLKKRTPKTITVAAKFWRELEKVKEKGYAVDDEENSMGARCVAAAIFDETGNAIAAIGVTGTTAEVNRTTIGRIVEQVKEATQKISQQFGYMGDSGRHYL